MRLIICCVGTKCELTLAIHDGLVIIIAVYGWHQGIKCQNKGLNSYLTVNKVSLHYKGQPFNVVKGSKCYFFMRTVANTQIYSEQNAQLLKAEGHCTYSSDYASKD